MGFNIGSFAAAMNGNKCDLGVTVFKAMKQAAASAEGAAIFFYHGHVCIVYYNYNDGFDIDINEHSVDRDAFYKVLRQQC